jgi:hypothetical protein
MFGRIFYGKPVSTFPENALMTERDDKSKMSHHARRRMPLQNRVDPFGELEATPARGLLMGNRGGRFHTDGRALTQRRWASRQWICCVLAFKNRHREVWGNGYTELFFLDEVTALAAGHRPCFECRRADAQAFAACWARAFGLAERPRAADMDRVLHAERLNGRAKRLHLMAAGDLPDGAMVQSGEGRAFAVVSRSLRLWTPSGYGPPLSLDDLPSSPVPVLTPPAIVATLKAGYRPQWHPGATTNARSG